MASNVLLSLPSFLLLDHSTPPFGSISVITIPCVRRGRHWCVLSRLGLFSPARLYDIFGEVLSIANAFALVLCALLTVKGIYMPSSSDCGRNSSILYDLWWGVHPVASRPHCFVLHTCTSHESRHRSSARWSRRRCKIAQE